MNVYDSDRMAGLLAPLGYALTDAVDDADMVLLNTCHIREKAAEKVYSELGRINKVKQARQAGGGAMILGVAGCVAQAEGEEVLKRAPYVDMVFGPQTYHRLPEMVARLHREKGAQLDTDFPEESKFDHLTGLSRVEGRAAFLTVQEGCDKFCTFCVVPYTRGAEFSRPVDQVLTEARQIVAQGAVEITLLGQNVNAYHGAADDGAEIGLGELIRRLADIDGIERLRYTTSYPAEVDDALIAAHRDVPELMPYLHLPVQSGADRVLKAMNRRHGRDFYIDLVARLRAARPDLGLSSDFIVGFPGETDADFQDTMSLVREVGYVQAYSFKYSPRPGTPAAAMELQVPEDVKDARLKELQDLLNTQQLAFNESCVGRTLPVLLDRPGRHAGQLLGRSPYMQAVHVEAPADWLGRVADLKIVSAGGNSLGAVLADTPARPAARRSA
ncbi:tRNA (N6-isopentenyl adenosine(37)-C2)-methylthiotransferase MiaB [Thalassospiraceae bacterium LMO-SO8]|nr:tRNA (N6-isopentenyl adenosine(37)-C2)-methylthiotransferase MiaB [Alphaproteobacteria bacterium LMO-S08]WND78033.1 tRNA (N6-isopentenyl adenosine(37)-C2)-methylthiotransferase MiaB [Thalassospiraceae bacterium LMO-SO8]